MTLRYALASLLVFGASPALAAGRIPYGGELRLAHTGPSPQGDPTLADTPVEATLLGLQSRPICRLGAGGESHLAVARELSRPMAQTVRITLPSLGLANTLTRAWTRFTGAEAPSPYRALLFPVNGEARQLSPRGTALELPLAFPWPDLERSLCHPALALPVTTSAPSLGPFASTGKGLLEARLGYPEGRPYLDRILLTPTDERGLTRMWTARQVHVALGALPETGALAGAALHATYLAYSPRRVPTDFRQAFESAIDRDDLTRLFVRAPAVSMPHLLPPALLTQAPRPRPGAPSSGGMRPVTLLYDAGIEDQRAVAERIQVKLHERGYKVALEPQPRAILRSRWAKGDFDLMLHSLLLPPIPGPALAVVLDAAGRRDLLGVELPLIGAVEDTAARDTRARERALALAPSVPLLPLYAQGLGMRVAPGMEGLVMDAQGLPLLEGAYLLPETPASPGGQR
ncbi:peptide ABC transporter substrate-binding protein [Stigmatella sp. ncwal1]|uniref:Peptide ABC transporter substrate-binding protein n=1 Tax=Stigmatella ashevillensis TaxID=2995309 RepID=A0ABT5D6Z3_9BACT|nr:peptide ABC transporter substrate-binding protein [Stigmatella ashevillena]MDC0709326.1 peptide ABC transporter substrate-binding protein [Stigmatella ashevillena]